MLTVKRFAYLIQIVIELPHGKRRWLVPHIVKLFLGNLPIEIL